MRSIDAALDEIAATVRTLHEDGHVVELRALSAGTSRTVSGYYDSVSVLARDAARWDTRAKGLYITLHEINPAVLARAANRVIERAPTATSDGEVLRYRWLPIDLDPERPAGISSNEVEHDAALSLALRVQDWLISEIGVPADSIVRADSGNGGHVLVRIDEPADAATRAVIERSLRAIDLRWGSSLVKVDTSNANPSRIWKLYGTLAAKGDATSDRPHRRSRVLEAPESPSPVGRELLERLAALLPEDPHQHGQRLRDDAFDIEQWLERNAIAVARSRPWQGGLVYELDGCPMDATHERDRAAYIVRHASGALSAGCHHSRCQGWGWRELRARYETGVESHFDSGNGHRLGEGACRNGIEGSAPAYRWPAKPLSTLSSDGVEVDWIWDGYIAPKSITMFTGVWKGGKTTILSHLMKALGQEVENHG